MKQSIYSTRGCGGKLSRSEDEEEGRKGSCHSEEEVGSRKNGGAQRTGSEARWGGDDGWKKEGEEAVPG